MKKMYILKIIMVLYRNSRYGTVTDIKSKLVRGFVQYGMVRYDTLRYHTILYCNKKNYQIIAYRYQYR